MCHVKPSNAGIEIYPSYLIFSVGFTSPMDAICLLDKIPASIAFKPNVAGIQFDCRSGSGRMHYSNTVLAH